MKNIDIKKKWKVGIIIIAILGSGIFYFMQNENEEDITIGGDLQATLNGQIAKDGEDSEEDVNAEIILHIAGAVNSPKVVILKEGNRVYEAIDAAGGLKDNADSQYLNMAAKLKDGDKLYIPFEGEFAQDEPLNHSNKKVVADMKNKGYITETESTLGISQQYENSSSQLININTATSEQLQTLTGVGPSTAEKILTYRNSQGEFKKADDLKNVSGIGEKTFQKFMDKICVD